MAALSELRVKVTKATPVEDHSTYRYHVALQHGETSWEVAKRFSEFDALLQALNASRYAGLPKLPSKTLLGSPTDTAVIEARKEQLRILLNDLLMRPDTRTSQSLRQFLAIDSHVASAIRSIQPEAIRTFEDPRFGVSGLAAAPDAKLLLVTHEDSTHLSRLGRVWSVVEPDELGALHLWSPGADGSWKRLLSKTFGIKVRSLCWEGTTRQFFVGLEDGKIEVYTVTDKVSSTPIASLELHHKSPVTHLSASPRKLLSLGYDTAMRTIDVRSRELLCGGRLQKRFRHEGDYLTCGVLDDANDRAFIGTSGGDLFILDIARNPPSFLHTADALPKPISQIYACEDTLYIAHSDSISAMSFEAKGSERQTARKSVYRSKHLIVDEVTIMSLAVAPERQLLFGGYSDGSVAIWRLCESEAFIVLQAHQSETTQLAWIHQAPWGPALLTGGGDGKVITWSLTGNPEDYAICQPPNAFTGDLSSFAQDFAAPELIGAQADSSLAAFEPSWGGDGADAFRVDNPRVNPQALKQAGESDSDDDDLAGALR
eukprot:TRINITY_DN72949_c0_g1_i1.p1 TRINITY_DN72949_c0_g1~~TRINITY_DN72949_c0_g1_i1.p1  ORF type:complete len:543 (-),score=104.66 TRINITY_DN72949_c0_g1_i1:268-1896(-)